MKRSALIVASLVSLHLGNSTRAAQEPAVVPFLQDGVIVDVQDLFPLAAKEGMKGGKGRAAMTHKEVAARALVTEKGVYAFLESPENQRQLKNTKSGTTVRVKGRLLTSGSLLHVDSLSRPDSFLKIDVARYADESGTEASLQGTNKCQCGLNVSDLPHSCALGHLHHLEATDGKIYNYLQYGDGKAAFLGQGTHFRGVEVKARVFPGNFLLVEKGRLLP
jgi:hypothetical protein